MKNKTLNHALLIAGALLATPLAYAADMLAPFGAAATAYEQCSLTLKQADAINSIPPGYLDWLKSHQVTTAAQTQTKAAASGQEAHANFFDTHMKQTKMNDAKFAPFNANVAALNNRLGTCTGGILASETQIAKIMPEIDKGTHKMAGQDATHVARYQKAVHDFADTLAVASKDAETQALFGKTIHDFRAKLEAVHKK